MPWIPSRPDPAATRAAPPTVGGSPDWTHPTVSWEAARKLTLRPEREWAFPLFTERAWVLSGRLPRLFYEPLRSWQSTTYALWLRNELAGYQAQPTLSLGFRYFDGCYRALHGNLKIPGSDEPFRGRHVVDAIGMTEDRIVFTNSWGREWGRNGLGTMSREYFEAYVDNVMVRWLSASGPSPAMFDALRAALGRRQRTKIKDFRAHWATPNPSSTTTHSIGGRQYTLELSTVVSLESWEPTWVLELRNPLRPVARAHYHQERANGSLIVKELFVDPKVRGRGLGSFLAINLESVAQEHGLGELVVCLDEADNQMPAVGPTRQFFAKREWSWTPCETVRPVLIATARKGLP